MRLVRMRGQQALEGNFGLGTLNQPIRGFARRRRTEAPEETPFRMLPSRAEHELKAPLQAPVPQR